MSDSRFMIIACVDGQHQHCSGFQRGDNRPCECTCHASKQRPLAIVLEDDAGDVVVISPLATKEDVVEYIETANLQHVGLSQWKAVPVLDPDEELPRNLADLSTGVSDDHEAEFHA